MTLAQSTPVPAGRPDPSGVVVPVAILIAATLVLFIAIYLVRRKLLTKDQPGMNDHGMLTGLRDLRDKGLMSDAEYDAARKKTVARLRENKPPPAPSR